jgi:hypothetical protein
MPHSSHVSLTPILEHVVRMQPRSVLDIGVGYGKLGLLVREALDFMDGRHERSRWRVRIDGIDAYPYESPLHDWVYDSVRIGDAVAMADELRGYDLVLLGDVIEHFDKPDGLRFLATLLEQNRNAIVATPYLFFEQETENPYETHRSHWTRDDFDPWPHDYVVAGGSAIVVALAGAGAEYPTRSDARAGAIAYRLLPRRGAAARLLKQAIRRFV